MNERTKVEVWKDSENDDTAYSWETTEKGIRKLKLKKYGVRSAYEFLIHTKEFFIVYNSSQIELPSNTKDKFKRKSVEN